MYCIEFIYLVLRVYVQRNEYSALSIVWAIQWQMTDIVHCKSLRLLHCTMNVGKFSDVRTRPHPQDQDFETKAIDHEAKHHN